MMQEWYKLKQYPHIDLPMEHKGVSALAKYVTSADAIAKHAFLPLIRRQNKTYRFKDNGSGRKQRIKKIRNITYASHVDSVIYSYYAYKLQKSLEKYLYEHNLNDEVCAYRKIRVHEGSGNKCNIHIAKEVFDFIREKTDSGEDVAVITYDIKGFFDNLDHKIIKDKWKQIIGVDTLPRDVYAVYKSITRYAYVMEKDIFDLFKDEIICKQPTKKVKRKVKRFAYLRDKKAIAFCNKDISTIRAKGLIRTRGEQENRGIPQGLPISAVIANVYMCDFDNEIANSIRMVGGLYRRYSDDIIIVCPINQGKRWKNDVIEKIKSVKLEIEDSKTNLFTFVRQESGDVICSHEKKGTNKKLEYLGFSFDGKRVFLKEASVGKFYTKMDRHIKRSLGKAIHMNNDTYGKIFENQLIRRFSYAGSKIHLIRKRCKSNHSKFYVIKGFHTYGNYLTYVRKSADIMKEPSIRMQLRRVSSLLRKKMRIAQNKANIITGRKLITEYMKYGHTYH